MIWLLAVCWFIALILACWPNVFWHVQRRKLLSIVLLETCLLVFFRLHDGHWPVAALGVAVGSIFYIGLRDRARRSPN